MGGANDKAAVVGEEAVRRPFQRRADMRAGIHVDEDVVALADGEQASEATGWWGEAFGGAVGQIFQPAECTLSPPPNPLPQGEGEV